jgi:hypothetical protein
MLALQHRQMLAYCVALHNTEMAAKVRLFDFLYIELIAGFPHVVVLSATVDEMNLGKVLSGHAFSPKTAASCASCAGRDRVKLANSEQIGRIQAKVSFYAKSDPKTLPPPVRSACRSG